MAEGPLVVLDANVLYPFQLRNFLLHAAEFDLFQPIWSAEILEEARAHRVSLRAHPLDPAAYLVSLRDNARLPRLARFLCESGFLHSG